MPIQKPSRIVIDTNIWISFLIGKELQYLRDQILNDKVKIIISEELIIEIQLVTSRDKLKKYFNPEKVSELISLLEVLAEKVKIKTIVSICRDPKDDFLLALSKESKANYLITGDKDLLDLKAYGVTKIVTAKEYKEILL